MPTDVLQFRTTLGVEHIKEIFSSTLQSYSRKVEFGPVSSGDNPFVKSVDFEAYASLKTLLGGWIVQIYINDYQDIREVALVPLGSSALGRAMWGARYTYSRSASREKAATVLGELRSADPALTSV
ncbi:hypothetical protein QR77_31660 [Streptomyces sp. 150FB]|uniref:hypothetical protein n=1 Tax=Streptomyces sp. 150FB TaxID=1576605 RepID=UPI000589564E|nr:hypothetical protein [Streptomyces sp. 150FB]KIF77192.1 hypothetical protein QR77_31660 [Streptomyces sp. 150FB]